MYRLALEQLGVTAADCLAVEDSAAGLTAAAAAAIATVITRNEFTRNDDFEAAVLVLDHLDDDGSGRAVDLDTLRRIHRARSA